VKQYALKLLLKVLVWQQQGRTKSPFIPQSIRSALFVEMTRFGDVVSALPAIQSLRTCCPEATISVAVQEQFSGILENIKGIDRIFRLRSTTSIGGLKKAAKELRQQKFDLAMSMSPSMRNALLTLRTDSRAKIGYFKPVEGVTPFLHTFNVMGLGIELAQKSVYDKENISVRAKKVLETMGIPWVNDMSWSIPAPINARVVDKLVRLRVDPGQHLIIIHPFAGWEFREWKFERYLETAQRLSHQRAMPVLLIGTKMELDRVRQSVSGSGSDMNIHLYAIDDISEFPALLNRADLFIGNDSGPMHLAAMMGVPCVGLYGPASPEYTAPVSDRAQWLFHQVECSPCGQVHCVRPENPCVHLIAVDEVVGAAEALLADPRNGISRSGSV
jgi:ADP-heptose:LPS heptosyltransferase